MASMGGFDVPILHGLCTYGITTRVLYQELLKEDTNQLVEISGRFTSHVFPGETLIVDMWQDGNKVIFETKTKERGLVVLKGSALIKQSAKM